MKEFTLFADDVPNTSRDVLILMQDMKMAVGFYESSIYTFLPINISSYDSIYFQEEMLAWAELPEVEFNYEESNGYC